MEEELRMERESQTRLRDTRLWEAGGSGGDKKKHQKKEKKCAPTIQASLLLSKLREGFGCHLWLFGNTRRSS